MYTPEWARDRTWDFTIDGDMYPNAVGLLPFLYQILTRLEVSLEFATYLFQILSSSVGAQLVGTDPTDAQGAGALSGLHGLVTPGAAGAINPQAIIFNLPAIVQTIGAALQFVSTNAHFHYHDQPLFGGLTAVDRAAQIING